LAETIGKHRQICTRQIVLPDSKTETKIENTNNIGVHSYCLWPWENNIIFPQVQINRQFNVPMREGGVKGAGCGPRGTHLAGRCVPVKTWEMPFIPAKPEAFMSTP